MLAKQKHIEAADNVIRERIIKGTDKLLDILRTNHPELAPASPAEPESPEPPPQVAEAPPVVVLPTVATLDELPNKRPTVERIIIETAAFYKITPNHILSHRHFPGYVKPRHVAYFLSRELTLHSMPSIGRKFSDRCHTTIMHGVRKIESQVEKDDRLRDEIDLIKFRIAQTMVNA